MITRPYKAVIGTAFLVLTDVEAGAFYLTAGDPPAVHQLSMPPLAEGPIIRWTGGSCRGNVVLAAGHAFNEALHAYTSGLFVSSDGSSWRLAHQPAHDSSAVQGGAIVWTGGKFHHSYAVKELSDDPVFTSPTEEYVISSANGVSWSAPDMISGDVTDEISGYRSPFPGMFCGQNHAVDAWEQHVPDGFMYQHPVDAWNFIRPKKPAPMSYSHGWVAWDVSADEFEPSAVIEKGAVDGTVITTTLPGNIFCVAAAGGVVVAGGFGLFISRNNGTTWKSVDLPDSSDRVVVNITAIPAGSSSAGPT